MEIFSDRDSMASDIGNLNDLDFDVKDLKSLNMDIIQEEYSGEVEEK